MASDPPPPDPASVVLTFLESVGRRSDAEFYLRLFRQLPKESFAVLAVEATALRYALPSLVDQLRFLRDLGLFVPVVLGLFEPKSADRAAARLAERCEKMNPRVYDTSDPEWMSHVRTGLRSEALPIVSLTRLAREDAAARYKVVGDLLGSLKSRKLVVVRRRGGFAQPITGPGDGRVRALGETKLSVVNLTTDFDALAAGPLPPEDLDLMDRIRTILLRPDCRGVVASVTSPLGLLSELFTTKGSGTLFKRGSVIQHHGSYDGIDKARLKKLLESSFERKLLPGFFERSPLSIYLEEAYLGAAIIAQTDIAPLLTKFAVERVAQGEGMGRDLWQAITRDHASLFWRARVDNPIASWYRTLCDGMMRAGKWNVYFRGIALEQVPDVVRHALNLPEDFSS